MAGSGPDAAIRRLGRYHLVEPLGGGPTGEVFRAKVYGVAGLERQFAVKRFHPELVKDPDVAARIAAAARKYGSLEHPRIARLQEYGVAGGDTFSAVEFVVGLDVARLVETAANTGKTIVTGAAVDLLSQAARAIGFAHGRGIPHLGICPTNLVCNEDGVVKVTDFGILPPRLPRRPANDYSLSMRIPYLAPEQLVGEPTSSATDVFQLGVVAYELLTGRRAFTGATPLDVSQKILSSVPEEPQLPKALLKVLMRCMARSPFERYPDAGALADALDAAARKTPLPGGQRDIATLVREGMRARSELGEQQVSGALSFPLPAPPGAASNLSAPGVETVPAASGVSSNAPKKTIMGVPVPKSIPDIELEHHDDDDTQVRARSVGFVKPRTPFGPPKGIPKIPTSRASGPPPPPIPGSAAPGAGKPPPRPVPPPSPPIPPPAISPHQPTPPPILGARGAVPSLELGAPGGGASAVARPAGINPSLGLGPSGAAPGAPVPPSPPPPPPPPPIPAVADAGSDLGGLLDGEVGVTGVPVPGPVDISPPDTISDDPPTVPRSQVMGGGSPYVDPDVGELEILPLPLMPEPEPEPTPPKKSGGPSRALLAVLGVVVVAGGGFFAYTQLGGGEDKAATNQSGPKPTKPVAKPAAARDAGPTRVATDVSDARSQKAAVAPKAADAAPSAAPIDAAVAVAKAPADAAVPAVSADAAPTKSAPSADGKLHIASTPKGAKIYIDGSYMGRTPKTFDEYPDTHRLALIKPGYKLFLGQVSGTASVDQKLEPVSPPGGPAGIKVRCRKKNRYYVFVNGHDVGQLCPTERIGVDKGKHVVEIYDPVTDTRRSYRAHVKQTRNSLRVRVD